MRLVCLYSILLTITVCSIASNNAAPTNEDKQSINASAVTTAFPAKPTNAANPDAVSHASIDASSISSTIPVIPDANAAKATNTTKTAETTTPFSTNAPTKPTTVVPPTSKKPPATTDKPTDKPTSTSVEPSTTTSNQTTVAPSVTTAIPISTKEAPPHKERQFDGLSFIGGIILAVCLMAIATFSYKFYRTLNERNYRIL